MALDKRISELPPASEATLADLIPATQSGGNTRKVTGAQIVALLNSGGFTFPAAVDAAFAADTVLDWKGGDVTLSAPIVLTTLVNKIGFGIRLNGAKINCAFNDATKFAISLVIGQESGHTKYGVSWRNFILEGGSFVRVSNFAGALLKQCHTGQSWIYSWRIENITVDNHSDYAFVDSGSSFEGRYVGCVTTGGVGGHNFICRGAVDGHIEVAGPGNGYNPNANNPAVADGDKGLPSALYISNPNIRDFSGRGILMSSSVENQEPFDLTVRDGYIVTGGGEAIHGLSGLHVVSGLGIENTGGGRAIYVGYRGGQFYNVRGANPVASSNVDTGVGMGVLIDSYLSNHDIVIEDCSIEDEGSGSGSKLAKIGGTGNVFLTRSGLATNLQGSGPTVIVSPVVRWHVRSYGAVGDGTTDDRAALQAAIDAVSAAGDGELDCTGGRWLVDSGHLTVKKGVTLVGSWLAFGRPGSDVGDFSAIKGAIILNPSYEIKMGDRDTAIKGLVILRKGMTAPTTLRTAITAVAAFAGTAIRIGDGSAQTANDCWLSHLFIAGFAQAITGNFSDRSRMEYIYGDNLAGIYLTKSYDAQHLTHVHFWPFVTAGFTPSAWSISGAVTNGGLIRLTVPANTVITGDRVTVVGVGGVPNATGAFTATVIDSTHIDLQGSTFAGTYTSGGTIYLSAWYRSGVGINFDTDVDWAQLDSCFAYNYSTGIRINDCDQATLVNCGTDSYAVDTTTTGFHITGASEATAMLGCKSAGQGTGLKLNTSSTNRDTCHVTNHRSWGDLLYSIEAADGHATFVNCEVKTGGVVRVDTNCSGISFVGGDLTGATFSYQSATAPRPSFSLVKGIGPKLNPVINSTTGLNEIARFEAHYSSPGTNDGIYQSFWGTDSAGAQVEMGRWNVRLSDTTAGSVDGQMFWDMPINGSMTNLLFLLGTALVPVNNDGLALGTSGSGWSDGFFATGAVITFGGTDYTITHSTGSLRFSKPIHVAPGASVTPANNGDVTFQLTNNTTLTFKAKGSDGTVRSGAITLA